MTIKTTWTERPDPIPGTQIREAYRARGLTREQAAAIIDISVVRLWLLEVGEVRVVEPTDLTAARLRILAAAPANQEAT